MITKLNIGLSAQDDLRSDLVFKLPSYSPTTHGLLQIEIVIENDCVISARPILGSMHRGAEKLFESRDYRQILSLANRHEWTSAVTGEIGVAQLLERELGIAVPQAASWFRTLLIEIQRITSHLAFLAGYPWESVELARYFRSLRESWVCQMQNFTGGRMHPMVTVFGGLSHAPTSQWCRDVHKLATQCVGLIENIYETFNAQIDLIPHGLGTISSDDVTKFSLSGPVARASGWSTDLRMHSTTLRYLDLATFTSVSQNDGDVRARLRQLNDEIRTSLLVTAECAMQCEDRIGEPINVLLPKVIRVPEGQYTSSIETPLGIATWFLESRGDKYPYRLKLRPASLHTVLAMSSALVGAPLADVGRIVASMPFITGDAER